MEEIRLDKYLKVSRLIKRRTVADEACDGGHVKVNGTVAKAGRRIRAGDVLEIALGRETLTVRVLSVKEHALKEDASALYEVLDAAK